MANVERHDAEWRHIISETRGEIRINYCHSIEAADVFLLRSQRVAFEMTKFTNSADINFEFGTTFHSRSGAVIFLSMSSETPAFLNSTEYLLPISSSGGTEPNPSGSLSSL